MYKVIYMYALLFCLRDTTSVHTSHTCLSHWSSAAELANVWIHHRQQRHTQCSPRITSLFEYTTIPLTSTPIHLLFSFLCSCMLKALPHFPLQSTLNHTMIHQSSPFPSPPLHSPFSLLPPLSPLPPFLPPS